MKLTPEEARKIDEALALLRPKVEADLGKLDDPRGGPSDKTFIKKIVDDYLSSEGLVYLLLDSALPQQDAASRDCYCGISCTQPAQGYPCTTLAGHSRIK